MPVFFPEPPLKTTGEGETIKLLTLETLRNFIIYKLLAIVNSPEMQFILMFSKIRHFICATVLNENPLGLNLLALTQRCS